MGLRITGSKTIENNIAKAQHEAAQSLERLSSGIKFTKDDPQPAERAVSDSMTSKMREIAAYKRNANDGMSVVQSADSSLNEISNVVVRLKELATQATSSTLSDKERKFLFVEYQALYEEIDRISKTTSFNGMNLLNGFGSENDKGGSLSITVGPNQPGKDPNVSSNVIRMNGLEGVVATTENLGLANVSNLVKSGSGVSVEDVMDTFGSNENTVSETFDVALEKLAGFRSGFGAVSSRLTHVMDMLDVSNENLASAQSRIRDVDYASEASNLTKAKMLMQAGTSLLAQGNLPAQLALTLINGLGK
jgi:flagellin